MAKNPEEKEADDAPAAEEAEGKKKGGIKGLLANKLVLGGLALVLLAGGGGAGWFFFMKKPAPVDPTVEARNAQAKSSFVEMKEMMINISGAQPGERQNFIKMKVALEIADAKLAPDIQPLLPRVEDMFQVYLRELRPADLEGSAGTFRLKEELLRRVNMAVHPAKVDAVLFKELLVQ
jgi:flagellar FliL protein